MAEPTNIVKWATDADALKEAVSENRKQLGWIKLNSGFGEKPSILTMNGWNNLVYRWIEYLFANRGPVGTMMWSALSESEFNSVSPSGDWVLCDGRSSLGTLYYDKTGRNTIPDMRAMFARMENSELDVDFYTYSNDKVSTNSATYEYENGDNYLSSAPDGYLTEINDLDASELRATNHSSSIYHGGFYGSSVFTLNACKTTNQSTSDIFEKGGANQWAPPYAGNNYDPNKPTTPTITQSYTSIPATNPEPASTGNAVSNKVSHNHDVYLSNNNIGTMTSSSVISVSPEEETDISTSVSRLLPNTACLNCFIRIN